jgi:hypothetical protein
MMSTLEVQRLLLKRARVYAPVCRVLPRCLTVQSSLAARKDEGAAVAI